MVVVAMPYVDVDEKGVARIAGSGFKIKFLAIDHIHLISRDALAAAKWYCDIFDGEIANVQEALRGAPQVDVKVNGLMIVIRGRRPGEEPTETRTMRHFDAYSERGFIMDL